MTLPEAAVGECGVGAHLTLEHLVVVQLEVLEVVLTPHVVPEPQPEPELARAQVAPVHGQLLDVHRQRPVDDGLDFLHNAFLKLFLQRLILAATQDPTHVSRVFFGALYQ